MTPRNGPVYSRRILVSAVASLIALSPLGALADNMPPPGHHDQKAGGQDHRSQSRPPAEHPEFNADQSGFARDYYRNHNWEGKPLPHGERVMVGQRIPKHASRHPLPPELAQRFPHRPGYEPYIVGDDIVLIAVATGIVVDVLANVH